MSGGHRGIGPTMSTWDDNEQLETEWGKLIKLKATAEGRLHRLSTAVMEGKNPAPGPYAFFHQSSNTLEKLQNCELILKRLFRNRQYLTELSVRNRGLIPGDWPGGIPFPKEIQDALREEGEVEQYMRLDFENLYTMAVVLLDQWSLQALTVGGIAVGEILHPFNGLVRMLEVGKEPTLQPLWDKLQEPLLWVYYQVKYYRNKFIVHANRPWQRGTTRLMYGDDFRLFTPTPPGWIDDAAAAKEIRALLPFAPQHIQNAADDYWEKARPAALIERIFGNIGNVASRTDRERIANLFGRVGGSTPSFEVVGEKILGLIAEGTSVLIEVAKSNMQAIDLGAPHVLRAVESRPGKEERQTAGDEEMVVE